MFKPSFLNIVLYIFIKYFTFYLFMMFKNDNFYLINPGIRDGADLFYYLWLFLSFPIVVSILFSVPIYYSFKLKKLIYFILIGIIILSIEYYAYTYFASQLNLWNGIYNIIISIILFIIFFHKTIRSKFIGMEI